MRPPKMLSTALLIAFALCGLSAAAEAPVTASDVQIAYDLDASAADNYANIRAQAWAVCKPEPGSIYASARNAVRRDCQKQVIRDVVRQLAQPALIDLAARDQIRVE